MSRRSRKPSNSPADGTLPNQQSKTVMHQRTTIAGWQGPLPPPGALEEFDRIVPGSAARIIDQFEKEAEHRRTLEDRDARLIVRDTHIGQFLAGLFAIIVFGVVAFAIAEGAFITAAVIGGSTAISVSITAFLRRPRK